jgi:outer membrane protein with beta-barrel domain
MREKKAFRLLAFLAVAAAAGAAQAADIAPVVRLGADFGGDTLVTAFFTDGSSRTIRANEGLYLGAGASFLNEARDLELELTINYKFRTIHASNGDIDWTSWPIDALAFHRWPKFRLGGGLTYHVNPKIEGSGAASGIDADFDNALGLVLQGDYLFGQKVALGLRYTHIDYKGPGLRNTSGNGLGAVLSVRF